MDRTHRPMDTVAADAGVREMKVRQEGSRKRNEGSHISSWACMSSCAFAYLFAQGLRCVLWRTNCICLCITIEARRPRGKISVKSTKSIRIGGAQGDFHKVNANRGAIRITYVTFRRCSLMPSPLPHTAYAAAWWGMVFCMGQGSKAPWFGWPPSWVIRPRSLHIYMQ